MQNEQPPEIDREFAPVWFIMTSPNPKTVEERLLHENSRREKQGEVPFLYFVPYQFLKRRIADADSEENGADAEFFNPNNAKDVNANNQLRSALKRYIFIKAVPQELEQLLVREKNEEPYQTLWYYRDRQKQKVTVANSVMRQFIDACCDKQIQFEVWPSLDTIEQNDEVVLNTTRFKGYKARVLQVHNDKKGGCRLTVGFNLFHGIMLLKLPNLRPEDLLLERKGAAKKLREANRYRLLEDMQRKLLAVMEHRLQTEYTEKEKLKDIATLEELYTYRYHTFESDVMRRKFAALMLLCATLRADKVAQVPWVKYVAQELVALQQQPEKKVAAEVRAFLQASLYLATGQPHYFNEAVTYFEGRTKTSTTQAVWLAYLKAINAK